jgi:hypothetical protein
MFPGENYIKNDFSVDEEHLEDADLTTLRSEVIANNTRILALETQLANMIIMLKNLIGI